MSKPWVGSMSRMLAWFVGAVCLSGGIGAVLSALMGDAGFYLLAFLIAITAFVFWVYQSPALVRGDRTSTTLFAMVLLGVAMMGALVEDGVRVATAGVLRDGPRVVVSGLGVAAALPVRGECSRVRDEVERLRVEVRRLADREGVR